MSCRVTAAVAGGGAPRGPAPARRPGKHPRPPRRHRPGRQHDHDAQRPPSTPAAAGRSVSLPGRRASARWPASGPAIPSGSRPADLTRCSGSPAVACACLQIVLGPGELRRARVDAGDVEHGEADSSRGDQVGVGPVRHAVGAHAPGEVVPHRRSGQLLRLCTLGLAGRAAGSRCSQAFWAAWNRELLTPSCCGLALGNSRRCCRGRGSSAPRGSACSGRRRPLTGGRWSLPHSVAARNRRMTGCCRMPPPAGPGRRRR